MLLAICLLHLPRILWQKTIQPVSAGRSKRITRFGTLPCCWAVVSLLLHGQVLRISGYTAHEKEHIARQYLQPQTAADAGVPTDAVQITDGALTLLITEYCRWGGSLPLHLLSYNAALPEQTACRPGIVGQWAGLDLQSTPCATAAIISASMWLLRSSCQVSACDCCCLAERDDQWWKHVPCCLCSQLPSCMDCLPGTPCLPPSFLLVSA